MLARGALSVRRATVTAGGSRRRWASSRSIAEKQRLAVLDASESFGEMLGVGGFNEELRGILRRVLLSRVVDPETRDRLGLKHARGLLLHGPPGTGKTLIARGVAKLLSDRAPVVVHGPEVFSHLLGASEQAVRGLFKNADDEWKRVGSASSLHVVVFDEVDSVLRKRGGGETGDGSTGGAARDGVVNQLLAKIDGMAEQSNILVVGTTNRLDLMDPAALRPGRLDVQVEIALPDAAGRRAILSLHAARLADRGALARGADLETALDVLAAERTANFSGAELEAVVRNAASFALQRAMDAGEMEAVEALPDDLLRSADEIVPVFGRDRSRSRSKAFAPRSDLGAAADAASAVEAGDGVERAIALRGASGAGKRTAADGLLAGAPGLAFQRSVDAAPFAAAEPKAALNALNSLFADARRSPRAALVLRDLHLWPRALHEPLEALLRAHHDDDAHGRLVLATVDETADLGGLLDRAFDATVNVRHWDAEGRAAAEEKLLRAVL